MKTIGVWLCGVAVLLGGCASAKPEKAGERTRVSAAEGGERMLRAYVSQARAESWYVTAVAGEVNKRKIPPHIKRHELLDSRALAVAVSKLAPMPGDMQLWQYAVCSVNYNACDGQCVPIGNGYHRKRDTVNNRYCAWNSQPTYCWDHFMVKCREHVYSDECVTELPEYQLDMYDWVCLD